MNSPSPSTRGIEIRRKVVGNRTVAEQGIKISWHPHPTICPLRWWVSEWESTSIERERLLELCLGQNGERYGRHSEAEWENGWSQGRPKADQRAQWNGGRETWMYKWTDKIPKNRHKCWELSARSVHLAREGWLLCLIHPLFKEIANLWRNSSVLSDDSTTIRVNVRLQRKREKQRQFQLTNIHGYRHRIFQSSRFLSCLSNSCFTVISERFSYHLDRNFRLPWDIFWSGQKTSWG